MIDLKHSPQYQKDKKFWQDKLPTFPLSPKLPIIKNPLEIKNPIFDRCTSKLPKKLWDTLSSYLKQSSFSPTGFLAAIFGEVLAKFSGNYHFALNLTLFDRLPLHPQINNIAGDFTSLFLLEIDLRNQESSILERVQKTHKSFWDALDHKLYSGLSFLRDLGQHHKAPVAFPIVLTAVLGLQDNQSQDIHNFFGNEVFSITQTPQVWLDYKAYEINGDLVVEWDYVKDLFPEGFIKTMHEVYLSLLTQLATDFEMIKKIRSVDLPNHQVESRKTYNSTIWKTDEENIYQAFSSAALEYPTNTALISPTKTLTYKSLLNYSNTVGTYILNITNQKQHIGIMLEKGWEQIVSVFGILASGNAYLPIDTKLPAERITKIIKRANLSLLITDSRYSSKLKYVENCEILKFNSIDFSKITSPQSTSLCSYSPNELAYTIFTSGSTGEPKGVMIQHKAVMNTIRDINNRLDVDPSDRTFCLSQLNFDLSVYDIFAPLVCGAAVIVPDSKDLKNPSHWVDLIEKHSVTIWNSVPMYMQMLMEYIYLNQEKSFRLESIKAVLLSGDWIPTTLPKEIFKNIDPKYLYSLGGATEASIWSIIHSIAPEKTYSKSIPYGKPLCNQNCYVLDEHGREQPDWVIGELFIGGVGLAEGYLKDEEKTKLSFVDHPLFGKLYKTGDLARHLPINEIEIIGRKDSQIKIRGHRIELGEILATLKKHPDIDNALILPQKKGLEITSLLAYFTPFIPKVEQEPEVILDQEERLKFKLDQLKIQNSTLHEKLYSLNQAFTEKEKESLFFRRKSYRNFSNRKLSFDELIKWLAHDNYMLKKNNLSFSQKLEILSSIPGKNSLFPKYFYPSAGNTYSVKVFIYIGKNFVGDIQPGFYKYNPQSHNLAEATTEITYKPEINSDFEILFTSQMDKINPLYGTFSTAFIYLEYGYMIAALEAIKLLDSKKLNFKTPPIENSFLSDPYSNPLVIQNQNYDYKVREPKKVHLMIYIKDDHFKDLKQGWYEWSDKEIKSLTCKSTFSLSLASDLNYFIYHNASAICFFLADTPPSSEDYIEVGRLSQKICSYENDAPLVGACAIGMLDSRGENIIKQNFPNKFFIQAIALGPIEVEDLEKKQESKASKEAFYSIIDTYLRDQLPSYMIPSQYIAMEKFPLSPNGKLDTRALPSPKDSTALTKSDLPKNEIEKQVLAIWQDCIHLDETQLSVHDNFFEIGGNSLSAIQVHHRLVGSFSSSIKIDDIFRYPTISKLSEFLQSNQVESIDVESVKNKIKKQKQRIKQNRNRYKNKS